MIVSYETLRTLVTELQNCEIGLLVCDEGHRLKNGESLTFTALTGLKVQRRVILSGTPIQNDLSEYFSLLNFANPNFLGSKAEFRKNYENSIIRGRDADASDAVKQESDAKLRELGNRVAPFIIRRTNELLSKYRTCAISVLTLMTAIWQSLRCTHADINQLTCSSPGQIRARRLLSSIGATIISVSTIHIFERNPKTSSGERITAVKSDQYPQEAMQSSRVVGSAKGSRWFREAASGQLYRRYNSVNQSGRSRTCPACCRLYAFGQIYAAGTVRLHLFSAVSPVCFTFASSCFRVPYARWGL
jgi:hypothetical protein